MKKIIKAVMIVIFLLLSSCAKKSNSEPTLDNISPTAGTGQNSEPTLNNILPTAGTGQANELNNSDNNQKIYCFDATKDMDATDYKYKTGMDLYYFSCPIESPYKYTFVSDTNTNINEIANELGKVMMEDLMKDYDGKAFIVTEYKDLVAHVMNEDELNDWKKRYYSNLGKEVEFSDNQWLCSYSCKYKYAGVYSGIGEMPHDLEWMETLIQDGSGENYVFIIQKINDKEYIMRALPKTIIVLKE